MARIFLLCLIRNFDRRSRPWLIIIYSLNFCYSKMTVTNIYQNFLIWLWIGFKKFSDVFWIFELKNWIYHFLIQKFWRHSKLWDYFLLVTTMTVTNKKWEPKVGLQVPPMCWSSHTFCSESWVTQALGHQGHVLKVSEEFYPFGVPAHYQWGVLRWSHKALPEWFPPWHVNARNIQMEGSSSWGLPSHTTVSRT